MGIAAPESPSWCLEEILHYYTSVPAWFPSETVGSTYDSHFRSLQPFSPGSVSNWTVGPLLLDNQILPSGPIPVDLKRCSVHPVPKNIPGEMQASQQKAVHHRQQQNLDFKIWRGRSEDRKVSIKLSLKKKDLWNLQMSLHHMSSCYTQEEQVRSIPDHQRYQPTESSSRHAQRPPPHSPCIKSLPHDQCQVWETQGSELILLLAVANTYHSL